MLLVVINDKKPQQEQSGKNAAKNFPREIEIPKRSRDRQQPQSRRGKNAPPTPRRVIHGINFGRQYKFADRPHACIAILRLGIRHGIVHIGFKKLQNIIEGKPSFPFCLD